MRRLIVIAAAAACPAAAYASTEGTGGFPVSAYVPEVCEIESSALVVDAFGQNAYGTVFEMCNSGRGFRVLASYRALGEGEKVELDYGGDVRRLDPSGMTDVAQHTGAILRNVPVAVRTSGLQQDLAISLAFAAI